MKSKKKENTQILTRNGLLVMSVFFLVISYAGARYFSFNANQVKASRHKVTIIEKNNQYKEIFLNSSWEKIDFKSINERAEKSNLPNLRSESLQNNDLEIRVWIEAGYYPLEGYVISRKNNNWSAFYLPRIGPSFEEQKEYTISITPKSGWDNLWSELVSENILVLPDSSELKGKTLIIDGVNFVIEINIDGTYRAYHYSNPIYQKWPEAEHINNIISILDDEFHLNK